MANAFANSKKGEFFELKAELNSQSKSVRKEAVRKTIAAMTVGRDVSSLFTDVLNCMQSPHIEVKKLVYLYIINYAHTKPDLAILAVNSFVRDAEDPNPMLRALAIRTMACIRVDKIMEYLLDPLEKALQDKDPYVRKTAAVCVAKLYAMDRGLVEEHQLISSLTNLLTDGNPMVVANAVASLSDIQDTCPGVLELSSELIMKFLHALNECNEWGQVFILDALNGYSVRNSDEADAIVERVTSRLQHANPAVVLSAAKLILSNAERMSNADARSAALRKLAAPLVTLLSSEAELQFVALRSVRIIVQKYPEVLRQEVKMFFCKYNDPLYVKLEKLEVMVALVAEPTVSQVIMELREYASEVDHEFVRKSIACLGRIALAYEGAADKCVEVLIDLVKTKVDVVLREVVTVLKNIFRSYRNRYEGVIPLLCENADLLDEPEARASMIWIIGEYADKIANSVEFLETFRDSFSEEASAVQLQLLVASVKVYLARGEPGRHLARTVIDLCITRCYSMDLRDRAQTYSRLLNSGLDQAKRVVLAEKPAVADGQNEVDPELLDNLLENVGNLNAVLLRWAQELQPSRSAPMSDIAGTGTNDATNGDLLMLDSEPAAPATHRQNGSSSDPLGLDELMGALPVPLSNQGQSAAAPSLLDDLFGSTPALPAPPSNPTPPAVASLSSASSVDPLSFLGISTTKPTAQAAPHTVAEVKSARNARILLSSDKGKGLQVAGVFVRDEESLSMDLQLENCLSQPMSGFAVQFNKNAFGVVPASPLQVSEPLQPRSSQTIRLPLKTGGDVDASKGAVIQLAIKCTPCGVLYMMDSLSTNLDAVLSREGKLEKQDFLNHWTRVSESVETTKNVGVAPGTGEQKITSKMAQGNLFFIATLPKPTRQATVYFFSARTIGSGITFLLELTVRENCTGTVAVRPLAPVPPSLIAAILSTVEHILLQPN